MRKIIFHIYFCGGLCNKTFTPEIIITEPNSNQSFEFTEQILREENITTVGALIDYLKRKNNLQEFWGDWGMQNFSWKTTYILEQNYMLAFQEDKDIQDIFNYFDRDEIELAHFYVAGGASIHNEANYRFTVHPDEKIHRNLPHVHVEKDDVEVRYSLLDLKPLDELQPPHEKDYKKKIRPFLEKNRDLFLDWWKKYNDGYLPPLLTEMNQQFYPES